MTGVVVWMTGLPSAGKSTLAERARAALAGAGIGACVLDGDAVRGALVAFFDGAASGPKPRAPGEPRPGYTDAERDAFYATLGRLAALLAAQGLAVLVPATAHKAAYRAGARALAPRFVEVHVRTAADECGRRDAKGLYAEARAGHVAGLPGVDLAYEPPEAPEVTAEGGLDAAAVERIVALARAEAA